MYQLVMYAYDLKGYQVAGGPAWAAHPSTDTDYCDIAAKADAPLTQERARQLVQGLLADRFQLKLHQERKEMPVYALVVVRGGPKLKENASDATCRSLAHVSLATVTETSTHCPMDFLVRVLSGASDRPVLNQTGLQGFYDFKLDSRATLLRRMTTRTPHPYLRPFRSNSD